MTQHAPLAHVPGLSPLDLAFARAMARLGGEAREDVLLAMALTSRAVSLGHVCLDLCALAARGGIEDATGAPLPLALPPLEPWLAQLRSSALVGNGATTTPLVLDGAGRLYLHRYHEHQRALAAGLCARAGTSDLTLDGAFLDRLFGANTSTLQRRAVEVALRRRLCVITGGPGTGKTTTVVRLMAAWINARMAREQPAPRILLVAPTGKAAARMAESIAAQRPALACEPAVIEQITTQAATIHRTLGARGSSGTRFVHDADRPLDCDLLVVDEASMVDLPLMRRLLDAVPVHAHVVLLGDADQLASVEAGAVLADICAAASHAQSPLHGCVVALTESHRYRSDSGIGHLAQAIVAGDAQAALELLQDQRYADIALLAPGPRRAHAMPAVQTLIRAGFEPLQVSRSPREALDALHRFRLLCAHRQGPGGVEELNPRVRHMLGASDDELHVARQPILITRNDHRLQLYNGDIGVLVPHSDGLRAVFEGASRDAPRLVRLARLPAHESVYAMSVHKSQGSEVDEVCIVLPDRKSAVLTRELLYTAVTRAKQRVTIVADPAVLAAAIADRVARSSGLADMLTTAPP